MRQRDRKSAGTRFSIKTKLLTSFLALSLVLFAAIGYVAIHYMSVIGRFAEENSISLGETAAEESAAALLEQSEILIRQKALDVAKQIGIYLAAHTDMTTEALYADPTLSTIAVQSVGETGYTAMYEKTTAIMRFHDNPELINFDMHGWRDKLPSWWKVFEPSLDGSISLGYYDWEDTDGSIRQKFMYMVPVEGTIYMVAATTYVDEFLQPVEEIKNRINSISITASQYIVRQKADMQNVFVAIILGLLVLVTGLAFWLARLFTKPVLALGEGARIIAKGDFSHRVDVKTGDEIEELAEQFNFMASNLQESYATLEQKVEERTAELSKSNTSLQEEIAQRQEAQEALRQSEVKYRYLVENANTIIIEIDTRGGVTFFNKYAREFFGYSDPEILGHSIIGTIVPPKDSAGKDLEAMIKDIVKTPERYRYNENENMRRNGERVWIAWMNQAIYSDERHLSKILCIGIDRTERKQTEEILAQQNTEKAAADERSRLARDLHDAVSQTLFSTSLIAEVLPRLWEKNQDEGRRRLEEVRQLTRGALAEMRTLLLELRPAALLDTELGVLLHQLAESITGRARVPVAVEVKGQCTLAPEVKVALYRIAQEALNNIAKHAAATQAEVKLDCRQGHVLLSISDNGRGMDTSNIPPDSLGLGIMRERARDIGATISIRSRPGGGTKVSVRWQNKEASNETT